MKAASAVQKKRSNWTVSEVLVKNSLLATIKKNECVLAVREKKSECKTFFFVSLESNIYLWGGGFNYQYQKSECLQQSHHL